MENESLNFTINLNGNAYKGILQIDDAVEQVIKSVESASSGIKNPPLRTVGALSGQTKRRPHVNAQDRLCIPIFSSARMIYHYNEPVHVDS